MSYINKFLEVDDFELISYQTIKKELEHIYSKILKKKSSNYGAKFPNQSKIHWSRDWEYPWAIISSEVKTSDTILDCGCGGSPLLPYLSQFGCNAYGIDPNIFNYSSIFDYYYLLLKNFLINIKYATLEESRVQNYNINKEKLFQTNLEKTNSLSVVSIASHIINFLKNLIIDKSISRRIDNLYHGFNKDPKKIFGSKIKFFAESLDKMHFQDNFFDIVYCISVIEHLPVEIVFKGIKEMIRVCKKNGKIVITMDNDGQHVNPRLIGKYQEIIDASGLELFGKINFKQPEPKNNPGTYNVVGFILNK